MAKLKQNETQAKTNQQGKADPSSNQQKGQQSGHSLQSGQASGAQSAVELLKQDHRKVEQLFEQFEQADDEDRQQELAHQICKELMVHAMIEEQIFYPACRSAGQEEEEVSDKLDEAQVEHDSAKILINEIMRGHPDDDFWKAKVSVLKDLVHHHVEEEEEPEEGIMAKAQEEGVDTPELANRLTRRKSELMSRADDMRPARAVSLMQPMHHMERGASSERGGRAGGTANRDRDEHGRFVSDERDYGSRSRYQDDDGERSRGWYSERRSRYEDDQETRGRRSHYPDDDNYGRNQGSYEDPRGYSEASSRHDRDERRGGRYEDNDDDRRGQGHGGWYGDSRGHAEASRRGWQNRR